MIESLMTPHPAQVLATGRGVEALGLAMLAGEHARDKVGQRLDERGLLARLPPGRTRAALPASRCGPLLEALWAAPLPQVLRASARKARAG